MRLCVETSVPIYQGRIDKTLFVRSVTAAGHRLPAEAAESSSRPPPPRRPHRRRRALAAVTALAALGARPAPRWVEPGAVGALGVRRRQPRDHGARVAPRRLRRGHDRRELPPGRRRIPASTMKLVTGAGALLQHGRAFRFETTVVAGPETARRGEALVGPIYLKGAGDPVLATRSYAAAYLGGRATDVGPGCPCAGAGSGWCAARSSPTSGSSTRGSGPAGLVLPPLRGAALRAADQPGLCGQRPGGVRHEPPAGRGPAPQGHPGRGRRVPGRPAAGGRRRRTGWSSPRRSRRRCRSSCAR